MDDVLRMIFLPLIISLLLLLISFLSYSFRRDFIVRNGSQSDRLCVILFGFFVGSAALVWGVMAVFVMGWWSYALHLESGARILHGIYASAMSIVMISMLLNCIIAWKGGSFLIRKILLIVTALSAITMCVCFAISPLIIV